MKNVCFIAGTRPEIIKVAPVIQKFKAAGKGIFNTTFCTTGQHKTMAEQAMRIFDIKPDHDLNIMSKNQTLNSIAAKIFNQLPEYFEKVKPDLVFIQGDTTTVAMTGLVAFNMNIPVAHIEAGLRTYNLKAPFPEELNRRIVSNFADFNFAPTENAKKSLIKENIDEASITVTGNTVVDALEIIKSNYNLNEIFENNFGIEVPFVLLTAHRRESFGRGFENICKTISEIANTYKNLNFVYPVHLNPNVREPVEKYLVNHSNIKLLEPVNYIELLALLNKCKFCITDSGGIQEEAPSFGKYTIVLRETTERTESIEAGYSELVGTSPSKIFAAFKTIYDSSSKQQAFVNPFGSGNASDIIFNTIQEKLYLV